VSDQILARAAKTQAIEWCRRLSTPPATTSAAAPRATTATPRTTAPPSAPRTPTTVTPAPPAPAPTAAGTPTASPPAPRAAVGCGRAKGRVLPLPFLATVARVRAVPRHVPLLATIVAHVLCFMPRVVIIIDLIALRGREGKRGKEYGSHSCVGGLCTVRTREHEPADMNCSNGPSQSSRSKNVSWIW
jgi:hypothetical protein